MMTDNINLNNFDWTLIVNDNISKNILKGNNWEPHIIKFINKYLKEGDVALDIGACFGWHTLQMARSCGKTGKIYAFEPNQINIKLLNKNLEQNNINNVTVCDIALGHKLMKTCICNAYTKNEINLGDSFISFNYESGIDDINIPLGITKNGNILQITKKLVICMPLDDIVIESNIKFIKIDVQGFEKMVLEGAIKTINKNRPVMIIEFEDPCMNIFGYSSKELISYIHSFNYYIYFLDYEYPSDHVCVPIEKLDKFETEFKNNIQEHSDNNNINNNFINGIVKKIVL
jgi:FkbM family methyltransferase